MVSEEENKQNTVGAQNEYVMVFFSVATMFCTRKRFKAYLLVFVVHIHQKSLVGRTKLITTENFVTNNSTRQFDLTPCRSRQLQSCTTKKNRVSLAFAQHKKQFMTMTEIERNRNKL
jgi:hypothetical protein